MRQKESSTYAGSGVDIERGEKFADFIRAIDSPAISKALGGFAGGVELDLSGYTHPVLLTTTDGVGTKLLVAKKLQKYDTIGIDLVAMCVNDLVVCGAQPQLFLDYIACHTIDEAMLTEVMTGIIAGCEQAGCVLAGGETAEMPDMYSAGAIDLAGFATGIVEKGKILPHSDRIEAGDLLLGLRSSGLHSNGFSLARRALGPHAGGHWEAALRPTRIYVHQALALAETPGVLGMAHITGGGLEKNLGRVIPPGLRPYLRWDWDSPEIFEAVQRNGNVTDEEMRLVFNMGVGLALVVARDEADRVLARCSDIGESPLTLGELVSG